MRNGVFCVAAGGKCESTQGCLCIRAGTVVPQLPHHRRAPIFSIANTLIIDIRYFTNRTDDRMDFLKKNFERAKQSAGETFGEVHRTEYEPEFQVRTYERHLEHVIFTGTSK